MRQLKEHLENPLAPDEVLSFNLQKLMKEHRLSEAELSRQARIPQPTLHKILAGKTDDPRISTIQALARYFGFSIDKLYASPNEFYSDSKPVAKVQSIPILSWTDCLKGESLLNSLHASNWDQWLTTENQKPHLYATRTKPSMEPRFIQNSLLVIDFKAIPTDGDIIVVHYPETFEATLRKILIDGPRKILTLINENEEEPEAFKEELNILGVVIQVRLDF